MFTKLASFGLASWLVYGAYGAAQAPFAAPVLAQPDDVTKLHIESGVTTMHLSAVSSGDEFTSLSHPLYPEHGVRIKRTDFCDPTVNVYTGYLDIAQGAKHLFFYFFESRRDPDNDDVMMWINGGPGCSASTGLLMELGPCKLDFNAPNASLKDPYWNPWGWNREANIFFLDQPVGVGLSYADYGEHVGTTEDAAKDIHAFITMFFETFSQFQGRAFHLSAESYGGRYLPVFASEIYDQNQIAAKEGRTVINLQSVIIGNGITDISTLYPGRYAIECENAAIPVPFQSISNCVRMKKALPRCQKMMQANCIDTYDEMNCRATVNFCETELGTPLRIAGRNNFDITKPCAGPDNCYAESKVIEEYMHRPDVLEKLGASAPVPFTGCSNVVSSEFTLNFDKWSHPTQYYVSSLLDRGIRVLLYAGTYDWQCNWVANKLWSDKLEWSGTEGYAAEEWRDWKASNATAPAGRTKSWGPLTFASVYAAGHMMSCLPLPRALRLSDPRLSLRPV
ncbi:unnamed protein product [Peniophora sp. CBMAI 1063]|nr:unnamed protein product [Peniophora sp. CBMAI 1063]